MDGVGRDAVSMYYVMRLCRQREPTVGCLRDTWGMRQGVLSQHGVIHDRRHRLILVSDHRWGTRGLNAKVVHQQCWFTVLNASNVVEAVPGKSAASSCVLPWYGRDTSLCTTHTSRSQATTNPRCACTAPSYLAGDSGPPVPSLHTQAHASIEVRRGLAEQACSVSWHGVRRICTISIHRYWGGMLRSYDKQAEIVRTSASASPAIRHSRSHC